MDQVISLFRRPKPEPADGYVRPASPPFTIPVDPEVDRFVRADVGRPEEVDLFKPGTRRGPETA